MYAIFKDGGHQYKAEVGKRIFLEYRDVEPGTAIELTDVLAICSEDGIVIGQPTIAGAKIVAEAQTKEKGPKLVIRWFRRRKNSRKKVGHRQKYLKVEIKEIVKG